MFVLSQEEILEIDAYFRACNYLSLGQLYLLDNPLLKRELSIDDIKPNVVGHWGTAPGQNFIYAHLNRIIKKYNLNMLYISGPGHGGEAMIANNYLDGTYSRFYPEITQDLKGMKKLFKQFSFPKGVSSHVAPEVPGSINEGGELGYSLAHAAGAVLDNPSLIVACVIGDGEAETAPLATSWNINKFLNKKTDGVVLPILHRNGYKIANPTVFGRMSEEDINSFFTGLGYKVYFVNGSEALRLHEVMAATLEKVLVDIRKIKTGTYHKYPLIVLTTPKGWTGPKEVEGNPVENSFRSHQIPLVVDRNHLENLEVLNKWLKSYHPEELFLEDGSIAPKVLKIVPRPDLCMGANPHANGGILFKKLKTPAWENYTLDFLWPGSLVSQDTINLGKYLKDVFKLNEESQNFRIFGPDEALSNRLNYIFDVEKRLWNMPILESDQFLSSNGRVMDSYLSEHLCEGMLEGYILTGRHGIFHSYEAFIRIIDSMVSQHAKWLKVCHSIPWRRDIASLNFLLVSHVFQQDHNGYTHQDPGFLNHLVTKKADIVRMYLPPDTNCLLSCMDHVLNSKNYINVVIASKHPRPQWLNKEQAKLHCTKGIGVWSFASNDQGEPDIVMACAGETPTLECLGAVDILRKNIPYLRIRVVNVVDLMKLESHDKHPHGLEDDLYDEIFTTDKPIIFNFHGYPSLIHQLTYKRKNRNLHVHGYKEEGTITTSFDIRVQNKIDRFNLVIAALEELGDLKEKESLIKWCNEMLEYHKNYIGEYGKDIPYIENWVWE